MRSGDPEQIREFKKSNDLLKWIHDNGAMNLSVIIMYSIVDSTFNAVSLSYWPFDPKRNVSTIVESFWFNEKPLMLLILLRRIFI